MSAKSLKLWSSTHLRHMRSYTRELTPARAVSTTPSSCLRHSGSCSSTCGLALRNFCLRIMQMLSCKCCQKLAESLGHFANAAILQCQSRSYLADQQWQIGMTLWMNGLILINFLKLQTNSNAMRCNPCLALPGNASVVSEMLLHWLMLIGPQHLHRILMDAIKTSLLDRLASRLHGSKVCGNS